MRILGRLVTTLSRLAAFGAGYVLGARAGRERYERLRSVVRQATKEPQVHPRPTRGEEPVGELSPIGDDDRL